MIFFSKLEIYSTYLVDSLRPHYSARRLVSSRNVLSTQVPNQPVIFESSNDLGGDDFLLDNSINSKKRLC